MADWYTNSGTGQTERLLGAWGEAPIENEEVCDFILDTAREQVETYARLPEGAAIPKRLVYAQLQQAKNLLTAGTVRSGGDFGEGEFQYQPRPLDKTIKGIIRPKHGGPRVR